MGKTAGQNGHPPTASFRFIVPDCPAIDSAFERVRQRGIGPYARHWRSPRDTRASRYGAVMEMGVDRHPPLLRRALPSRLLLGIRVAAIGFVLLELLIYFRWLPRWLDLRLGQAESTTILLGSSLPYAEAVWAAAFVGMVALSVWCSTALLILWRRSGDLFGVLLFVSFVSAGVIGSTDVFEILRLQRTDSWAPFPGYVMYTANAFCMLWIFVFPDGRFVPRWTAGLAIAWVAWNVLRAMLSAADVAAMGPYAIALNYLLLFSAVGSLALRYRARASVVQQNQLKWLLLGCLFALTVYGFVTGLLAVPRLQQPGSGFLLRVGSTALMPLSMIAVPVAMLVAIFRQGLLDVDGLIKRTLLYAALTALIVAAILLVSSAIRQLMERTVGQVSNLLVIVIALPLAFAVVPLRTRMSTFLDRVLRQRTVLTVMFLDIVDSTGHAVRLGDHGWADLLQSFRGVVRRQLAAYGGEEVDTAGDGIFASFVGPGGAIHCAVNVVNDVRQLGIAVRVGLHTGEVERYGVGLSGVAVHVGARIMALGAADEVLVSSALKELVAGSRIDFCDKGEHVLKGLPGTFHIYAFSSTT